MRRSDMSDIPTTRVLSCLCLVRRSLRTVDVSHVPSRSHISWAARKQRSQVVADRSCRAQNKDGSPCRARKRPGSDLCFAHDPSLEKQRREARLRGGRNRRRRTVRFEEVDLSLNSIADVIDLLRRSLQATLQLETSLAQARTVAYLASVVLRAMEVTHIERRLGELEQILGLDEGGRK